MLKRLAYPIAIAALTLPLVFALGCKSKSDESSSLSEVPDDPDDPATPPVATSAAPFTLKIYTTYDHTQYDNKLVINETGQGTCSVSDADPVVTCTVTVPEGRLYFSSLSFSFSWLADKCPLLIFTPYQYQASNSATYVPPGGDAPVDCSQSPTPVLCFGGAAVDLVPDYPKYKALLYEPDENDLTTPLQKLVKVNSASSHAWGSNRWTVNDMDPANIGTNATVGDLGGVGDTYLANTYKNYQFSCRDHWFDTETYSVTVKVKEEDSKEGDPVVNHFLTWIEW